jgi:hypothetical protein
MFNLDKFIFDRLRNTVFFVTATSVCISAPASAQTQEQLSTCKAAIVGLANVPSSIVKVSAFNTNGDAMRVNIRVTKPWNLPGGGIATDSIGYCDFDSFGKLLKIDTLAYSAQSPSDFQDFGEIPSIGRFIVILREAKFITGGRLDKSPTTIYYSTIGKDSNNETSVFPVLVNDKQQRWWADCKDQYIGKLDANGMRVIPLAPNTLTVAVSKLVCA